MNSGLMTFFFFVVGLEARREFDMGELRDRRRVAMPLVAGLGGMIVPVVIYLAFNAGGSSAHGWGTAMSTDTAFALGMLALVGSRLPEPAARVRADGRRRRRHRSRSVIAVFATARRSLARAADRGGSSRDPRRARRSHTASYYGLVYSSSARRCGRALNPASIRSIVGVLVGLLAFAYRPRAWTSSARAISSGSSASSRRRSSRVSARPGSPRRSRRTSASQQLYHPWTSYVIVPLFALANAGIAISGSFLVHAFTSPITLGILFGYLLGKPSGIVGGALLVTKPTRGKLPPPVGWATVAGAGSVAGIGFTVSILIATLAFDGSELEYAKVGVLSAALCAALLTWLVYHATTMLPPRLRIRALLGTAEVIVDLGAPVDPERDHIRGPVDAPVTVVEYGDFECPYCGQAEPVLRELLAGHGEVAYVWRHLPLNDVHPLAQQAAEAAEAAAEQGKFWEMHDLMLERQNRLRIPDLMKHAEELGLDTERFADDLRRHEGAGRIAEDVDSADLSGVSGTPSFFINGKRYNGAYDIETLTTAVKAAKARTLIAAGTP